MLAARAQFVITRSLIYHSRVVVSDVRDVGCLINDGDVALAGHNGTFTLPGAKFARGHEAVLIWSDVIIIVGPIVNATTPIEARLWGQRRPADVLVAFSP